MKTLSTAEVAAILAITRDRVKQLIYEKKLKAEKMGRDWRIMPRAVEEYRRLKDERRLERQSIIRQMLYADGPANPPKRLGHDPDRHKFANEHPDDVTF